MSSRARRIALMALLSLAGCGDDDTSSDVDGGGAVDSGGPGPTRDAGPPPDLGAWPTDNEYSWNGGWSPEDGDFPLDGLLDDEYFDGHDGSPVLPPGEWDWNDDNDDLANWRNFSDNLGDLEMSTDSAGRHYGWRFVGHAADVDYAGPGKYWQGSSGADYVDLGPGGVLHSMDDGNLGDGPDVLIFGNSYSLDFRTGSTERGSARDDDLVIAGCTPHDDGSFGIETSTIHTGPGSDWVFVRDLSRAAIDLGNGANGRTDTVDGTDGHDLVVLRGNTHDFRVFGGGGDDVAVWYPDDNVQTTTWLGPNFFGNGGLDQALWQNDGTDRLVMAVPTSTEIVTETSTPPGALLVKPADGAYRSDDPTAHDPFAFYCIECGTSPDGRQTMILEYHSADESVFTGFFYVTAFEEIQVGVGEGARVYRLDDVAGTVTLDDTLEPTPALGFPPELCE